MAYSYNGHGFTYCKQGYVKVFIEGACLRNGTVDAIAGIGVFFAYNHPLNVSQLASGRQTINVAEIQAATIAAYQAKKAGIKYLRIYTDSECLYDSATDYIYRWIENGWKTVRGTSVAHKSDFKQMSYALDQFNDVIWTYVHNGSYGNDEAFCFARAVIGDDYDYEEESTDSDEYWSSSDDYY